jgi:hypothetical protein
VGFITIKERDILMQDSNTSESVVLDDFPQELVAQQELEFKARMRQFDIIGDLTNWRKNVKNNSQRTDVLNGYNKIMRFFSAKL